MIHGLDTGFLVALLTTNAAEFAVFGVFDCIGPKIGGHQSPAAPPHGL
jgi:hypothetical protein